MSGAKDLPTISLPAVDLKAGMTLIQHRQRLLIDRVVVAPKRILIKTIIGELPIELNEEVDVWAVNGQPHFSARIASHF